MYITFYWRTLFGKTAATCAIPVMPNGRIALLKVYRHAIRAWTLEFPRGGTEAGRDVRDVLIRELREEAGIEVAEIVPLGEIEPDNGLLASRVPAYLVRVERVGEASKEYAETIEGLALFMPGEFDRLLDAQQYVEPRAGNVMRCYALRGSFEEVLFRRACRRGLITL
jgi:ADP-ribose pyrophosphatase